MSAPDPPQPAARLPIAVLISGRGGNMIAIANACRSGAIAARITRVISDQPNAVGIARAQALGIDTTIVAVPEFENRERFEAALVTAIDASGAQLVVLAGFMRILSSAITDHYAGRMLNIHPSLLPKFPGLHTHQRALAAQEREHGASVHFVTSELDAGPLVIQARAPVLPGDTAESLSARVQPLEHRIYPKVIGWIAAGRLRVVNDRPWFDGIPLEHPLLEC